VVSAHLRNSHFVAVNNVTIAPKENGQQIQAMIHKTLPKKLKILQNGMSTGAPDV
jgi:hypothetical protein